uniref:snRNA-activating protein complex subunit 3 n=1 Tax=Anopheles christyi TaxID=43041 RepID=A0A182K2P9_9DIPT
MDNVYCPRTEKVISVSDALAEFQNELHPERLDRIVDSDHDIMEAMGLGGNNAEFDRLLESVDVGQLSSAKDVPVRTFVPHKICVRPKPTEIPPKAAKFNCVRRVTARKSAKDQRNVDVKLRYNRHKYMERKQHLETRKDLIPFREMVLVFRFYEPFKYKAGRRLGHPKLSQEYYVLSSQYLTELKDKIFCHCDTGPFYEISEDRTAKPTEKPPKSGFFFIHDTFYNDLREDANHDYSGVVRKWAERQSLIGELKTKRMEDTRFIDLQFRLGYPQLYQHQGNCEHLFVISDCRLLATTDILMRARYPWLNSYGFSRDVPCNICGHCQAQYIVQNSTRHIFDPAYICENCLVTYHYTEEGDKIGEFELHRYTLTMVRAEEDDEDDSEEPSTSQ